MRLNPSNWKERKNRNIIIKNMIATPLIQTKKKDKNTWVIYRCYYYELYEFEYNIENQELKMIMRYIRKK